jgi:hypothetical protein
MENKGVIYILTNPSFPEYVKIGYADDVEARVKQLNNSEAVPFSFHIYATFDVTERLTDKKLHNFIDTLNPELRSKEKIGDKIEYYGMSTKRAQKEMGNTTLKTSEGKFLNLTKEYTLLGWAENFDSYLRSAMSYCDSRSLEEFREKSVKQVVSEETIKNVNNK